MKETINKINELNTKRNQLMEQLAGEFKLGLKQIFEEHPNVKHIQMALNNHEFNDGDTTYFDVYYDDMEIFDTNDELIDRDTDAAIYEKFITLFETANVGSFYEDVYGDEYGDLVIKRNNVLKG
jgi:hypothetical protein